MLQTFSHGKHSEDAAEEHQWDTAGADAVANALNVILAGMRKMQDEGGKKKRPRGWSNVLEKKPNLSEEEAMSSNSSSTPSGGQGHGGGHRQSRRRKLLLVNPRSS